MNIHVHDHVEFNLTCESVCHSSEEMYYIYLLLLMVTCLAYTTNSVVHYVVPDDYYVDTNDVNNTLQHYLNNSEKYFISQAQLVFLPGKHHLLTDLVIQDVHNLTLRGNDRKK